MSKLKIIRNQKNLTQAELSEMSGISVRTIQRIESGVEPKGQTLKILSATLGIEAKELLINQAASSETNLSFLKILNLSSLPFTVIPPANIILPVIIMLISKQRNPIVKQIISVQILWTIFAVILFILSALMKNWFSLSNKFSLIVMVCLILSNVFIILRNTAELDKKGKLFFQLNFTII